MARCARLLASLALAALATPAPAAWEPRYGDTRRRNEVFTSVIWQRERNGQWDIALDALQPSQN